MALRGLYVRILTMFDDVFCSLWPFSVSPTEAGPESAQVTFTPRHIFEGCRNGVIVDIFVIYSESVCGGGYLDCNLEFILRYMD